MIDVVPTPIDTLLYVVIDTDTYTTGKVYASDFNTFVNTNTYTLSVNGTSFTIASTDLVVDGVNMYYPITVVVDDLNTITLDISDGTSVTTKTRCLLSDKSIFCKLLTNENLDPDILAYYTAINNSRCDCECDKIQELWDEVRFILDSNCETC